jgi:hypothetical protein
MNPQRENGRLDAPRPGPRCLPSKELSIPGPQEKARPTAEAPTTGHGKGGCLGSRGVGG